MPVAPRIPTLTLLGCPRSPLGPFELFSRPGNSVKEWLLIGAASRAAFIASYTLCGVFSEMGGCLCEPII